MIPFILPSPTGTAATTNGARRDLEMTSQHPLTSPRSSVAPHIEWHPQPGASPSLSAFHDQSASNDIASRSFVEFHHNQHDPPEELHLGTTAAASAEVSQVRDRGEYSVNSRMGMAMADHAANMPTVLSWPLHPHPLHYAGSSSGDSLRITACRNCRAEHYNSAVYSCVERGCNFHICLACALEQLTAVTEAKQRDAHHGHPAAHLTAAPAAARSKKSRKGSKEKEPADDRADYAADRQRWDRSQGVGEGELVMKVEPGVTAVDVGQLQPITYTRDRLKREYESTKHWIAAVEYDARQLGMRLSTPCSLHPDHPLIYHAISPPPPVHLPQRKPSGGAAGSSAAKPAPALTDRYFCDAVLSPYCMSHDLNKHLRPVYACPHCNYRLCLPCYRWYLLDHFSRLRSSMSYEAADERIEMLMVEYRRSRQADAQAMAYSEVMSRREATWEEKRRYAHWVAVASALLAIVLINAMLTMADAGVAYALLNVVLILIGAITGGMGSASLSAYCTRAHRRCIAHYRTIDSLYLDPTLAFFFHTQRAQAIPIAAVTPKQRDRLSDVYSHHASVIGLQRAVLRATLASLLLLVCASGLLVAGVVVLIIQVVCELQVYQGVGVCQVRAGVPVAVLLFVVLMWTFWIELLGRVFEWMRRTRDEWKMYAKEERQRTKWQRRE